MRGIIWVVGIGIAVVASYAVSVSYRSECEVENVRQDRLSRSWITALRDELNLVANKPDAETEAIEAARVALTTNLDADRLFVRGLSNKDTWIGLSVAASTRVTREIVALQPNPTHIKLGNAIINSEVLSKHDGEGNRILVAMWGNPGSKGKSGAIVAELSEERHRMLLSRIGSYHALYLAFALFGGGLFIPIGLWIETLLRKRRDLVREAAANSELIDVMNQSMSCIQEQQAEIQYALEKVLGAADCFVFYSWKDEGAQASEWQMRTFDEQGLTHFPIAQSPEEPLFAAWQKAKLDDDSQNYVQALEEAVAAGLPAIKFEYRILLSNGEKRWIREELQIEQTPFGVIRCVGIGVDITPERSREAELERLAYYDPITGLPNRHRLFNHLSQVTKRFTNKPAAVMLVIDNYESICLSLGHEVGEQLLKVVGDQLTDLAGQHAIVGQMGANELVLLGYFDQVGAQEYASQMLYLFEDPVEVLGYEVVVNTRIGIGGEFSQSSAEEAVRHSGIAVAEAVQMGSAHPVLFTPELEQRTLETLAIQTDLRGALANQELYVVFQPIVEAATGKMVKAEALIRWRHPVKGFISPAVFIPIAEQAGLIGPFTDFVFENSVRCLSFLNQQLPEPVGVSINISARELTRLGLVENFAGVAKRWNVAPELITIEVTETSAMDSFVQARVCLDALHAVGFKIAIDDFGSGYCSMGYLSQLPVDILKVDKSILDTCHTDPKSRSVLEAICAIATALNLEVVCEGVETEEQVAVIRATSADYVQGYYFSKPLEMDGLMAFCGVDHSYGAVPSLPEVA